MYRRFGATLALCVCATACGTSKPPTTPPEPPPPLDEPLALSTEAPGETGSSRDGVPLEGKAHEPQELEVAIQSRSGSSIQGTAELTRVDDGVKVVVEVEHMEPGFHAVHIHEVPDCSAPDASSAGDHYNPEGHPHALPSDERRHLGDLGNLIAEGADGSGRLEIVVPGATLEPGAPRSLLNRALVVHADRDKGTQPSGDAGGRLGCAELTLTAALDAGQEGPREPSDVVTEVSR